MAGFLGAVTQAPLTAFIIVMEMVDGHSMVLSLMASAMVASLISRMISRPLYDTLAEHMLAALRPREVDVREDPHADAGSLAEVVVADDGVRSIAGTSVKPAHAVNSGPDPSHSEPTQP